MKKLTLISIVILFAWATSAQEVFKVPERKLEDQVKRTAFLMCYQTVCAISHGKTLGKSMEEIGYYYGNLYKQTWNKEEGFKGFVTWTIRNLNDVSKSVEILSQSPEKVVLKVTGFTDIFNGQDKLYNVTPEDYIGFFQHSHNRIADFMESSISFKNTDDGLEIVMNNNQ